MSEQPDAPRTPKGDALTLTDTTLDRAATVSPDDLDAGVRIWRQYVPRVARNLLDAEPERELGTGE